MVDIPVDCLHLIASAREEFVPVNIEALIPNDSEVQAGDFASQVVKASKIKMDSETRPAL